MSQLTRLRQYIEKASFASSSDRYSALELINELIVTHGMKVGGTYHWSHDSKPLIYMGRNWSGNGYWHQFSLASHPDIVWCEVQDSELSLIKETT